MDSLKVFVSYSHADKIVARSVARRLTVYGRRAKLVTCLGKRREDYKYFENN